MELRSPRYCCVARAIVRQDSDPSSPRTGVLKVGEIVQSIEEVSLGADAGAYLLIARADADGDGTGWVSKTARDGSAALQHLPEEEEEAQAAVGPPAIPTAAVAAAVSPPVPSAMLRRLEARKAAAEPAAAAATPTMPVIPVMQLEGPAAAASTPPAIPARPSRAAASDGGADLAAALQAESPPVREKVKTPRGSDASPTAQEAQKGRWQQARKAASAAQVVETMQFNADIDRELELEQRSVGDGVRHLF